MKVTIFFDRSLFQLGLDFDKGKNNGKQTIVFLGEFLPARIPRMAKWIKRKYPDYNLELICLGDTILEEYHVDVFDRVTSVRNHYHLKRKLKKRRDVYILHAFGPPCLFPAEVMGMGFKVIYDLQDLQASNFGLNPPFAYMKKDVKNEELVLKNADGIICSSLELQLAKRHYQFKPSVPVLYFPLFCDNDNILEPTKKNIEEIHIVYAGGIQNSGREERMHGLLQFHELIDKLEDQRIHFHIYPSPSEDPAYFTDYVKLSETHQYFHLHKAVSQSELIKEMAQYHFGILPFFKENDGRTGGKFRLSTSLKLFNYIETGLPVIVSQDITYQHWLLGRYGARISINKGSVSSLREKIEHLDYAELQRKLVENRKKIMLEDKIKNVMAFIEEVHNQHESGKK